MSDISELFTRDPLSLTRDDITIIVAEMRKRRGQFLLGNAKAGAPKQTEKQKNVSALAEKLGLKL